jgi:diadenosine tetraphosphatase ApaH/serine/threonine PP2A family protein phosphatase
MNTVFIIIGLIVFVIVVFAIYRLQKVKSQNRKLNEQRFERISPLYNKLEKGETISAEDVLPYAKNLLTRGMTFHLLSHHDKLNLFPKEYFDIIKGAESNLANWLEFPTELDACPDEIEHIKRVTFDYDGKNNFVHYEVFKYKVNEPHWAAKDGWILGVVGPYFDDSKPYDNAQATFSRVSSTLDKVSPDDEAKWVHENISKRR